MLRLNRAVKDVIVSTEPSDNRGETERFLSRYRERSDSGKSCSVDPAAECSEQTTLSADGATTVWTRPWQRRVWEKLELHSTLLTGKPHSHQTLAVANLTDVS